MLEYREVDPSHKQGLLAGAVGQDMDVTNFGQQPYKQIRGIRHHFDPLVEQGFSITVLRNALREVGIFCGEMTVRRYIERDMPEVYSQLYSRGGLRQESKSLRVIGAPKANRQESGVPSKNTGKKTQAKDWRTAGTICDEKNRVRANADDFFGKGMSDTFDFLKQKR